MSSEGPAAGADDHKAGGDNVEDDPDGKKQKRPPGDTMTPLLGDDTDGVEKQCEVDDNRSGNQSPAHFRPLSFVWWAGIGYQS